MTLQWSPTHDNSPTLTATRGDQTFIIAPVQTDESTTFGLGYGDGVIRWQYPDLGAAQQAAEEQSTKVSRAEAWRLYMEQHDPPRTEKVA